MESFTEEKLIELGYLIKEPGTLIEPITLSGYYQATNGFFYRVYWNDGQAIVSPVGESAHYLAMVDTAWKHGFTVQDKIKILDRLIEMDINRRGNNM